MTTSTPTSDPPVDAAASEAPRGESGQTVLPSVSVVIAAHADDRWPGTVDAVNSVLHQSFPACQVILVVDHNAALTTRARAELDGVTVVENTGPRGASATRNKGAAASHGDIIAFLDDDQIASSDWLVQLLRHFEDPDVLGVGGRLTLLWPGARPTWFPHEFDWVVGGSYTGMAKHVAPVRNVWGGNMAVRRSAFEAVGGFRAGFGKTGEVSRPEDTDLCLRVSGAFPAGHWLYDPNTEVVHVVPVRRSSLSFFLRRCWHEGRGKAELARLVGIGTGTVSERRYVARVLPLAVLRELRNGVMHADLGGLRRAAAIMTGLCLTTAGMVVGTVLATKPAGDRSRPFHPICVREWDVLEPFPAGPDAESVRLLVRMGSEPLALLACDTPEGNSTANAAAAAVSRSLLPELNARLASSGLPPVDQVAAEGLRVRPSRLPFIAERGRHLGSPPRIAVVLCTRDRPDHLARCLEQLGRQDYPNYEIIVVDNAPTDPGAVPAALDSLDVAVPVVYVRESRPGLSWARNAGWRSSDADIVAFIDDDEVPDKYWLAELTRGFAARPQVGCVSGAVVPAELRTEAQLWFEEFGGHSKGRGFRQAVFEPGYPQSPLYPLPPFGTGANMAFRRCVLDDIGGFDVALGAGTPALASEDTHAFTRVLLGGHTMVYQPTALTRHYHRETVAELRRQLYGYGVGLVACYAALIARNPLLILSLIRLIPSAIRDFRGKNALRTSTVDTLPADVLRMELRGMVAGLPAYLRSVREQRRKGTLCE